MSVEHEARHEAEAGQDPETGHQPGTGQRHEGKGGKVESRVEAGTAAPQAQPLHAQAQPEQPPAPAHAPALMGGATDKLQGRWHEIQIGFIDDPKHAVEEADQLLSELAKQLIEAVAARRDTMRDAWHKEGRTDTEELRIMLQDYRRLIGRLLQI